MFIFKKVVVTNKTLIDLNLSCNTIGPVSIFACLFVVCHWRSVVGVFVLCLSCLFVAVVVVRGFSLSRLVVLSPYLPVNQFFIRLHSSENKNLFKVDC